MAKRIIINEAMHMTNAALNGKPYAGNPHVRFEAGESRIGKPSRGSLLYKEMWGGTVRIGIAVGLGMCFGLSAIAVTCREDCWSLEDGDGAYAADGAKLEWSDGHVSVKPFADRFVLKYAFHPGARPKAGAVRLELVTHPVFAGAVRADFKCIGRPGTTNVIARRVGDRHVFDLRMPGKESWQLTQLAFSGNGDRRPFAVESVRWCAEGTSAEAFRLLPKRRADGLPLFFPEGGDVPGFVAENSADTGQEWSVCVAFTNRQGRFFSRSERISLPSGGRCQLDVPELRSCRGLWLAEATVRAVDGSMARRSARIGVLDPNPVAPRLPGGKFRMGVNFHMGRYSGRQETRALDAINALGAKLVRGGAFVFSSFQPKGPEDWQTESNDRWMGRLKERGLDVDAIVSFAPSWSWDAGHARLAKEKNWTYGAYSRPIPGAFGRFAEKLARRYGTDIAYYELGNEWDCISPEILTIDEGVELLKEVYAGLKRGNPDAILTTCGFAYGSSEDAPSMNQTNMHERITKEAAGFYDVHAVHAHCHEPHFSKRLGDFFRMRRRLGDNTPWYLNEAGISSFYGNEDVAAEYVWKKILFAWARGSRDYIWYTLRATGWNPKDFEQGFGLMTPDWNVRPAFLSFAALAHLLSGSDCDGILSDGDLQVYRFHDAAGNVVLAGWCQSDPKSYPFSLSGVECRRVDLMGNRTPVASADGRYDLAFGRVPCAYLFSSAASAASAEPAAATQVHPAFGSLSWRQGDPALAALPVRTSEGAELRLTNSAVSVFLHESRRGFVGRAAWLRVRDAGGEIFQYRPIASADAGENFILSYSVANGKHDGKSWGGRNDGKLDLPFVLDSIVMGFTPPGGTVRLVSVETDEPGSPTTPVAACRFEIDTGTAYHVVTSADSPVAAVFINPSGRPARLVGTLRGLDAFERSFRQPLDVCVGAGRSVRVPLQGPLPAKGHWNVCAELDDGARKVYKAARFAWLDAHPKRTAKPVGRFRLGINFHGLWMTRDDLEIGLDALDACGCELVRVAFSGQCAVQKKGPEDWNWNEDWYLEKLKARHFAIDNLCHHLPGWIRDRSRPQMANDLVALEEFYARMAARYGTDIDYYEIGNEWDFWKPEVFEPAAALETYLASARGVKRGCPSAKVVPNGWATWDSAHPAVRVKDFPESFMRQAHGHYDAFPIHEHGEFTHYRKAILERFLPRRKGMGLDDVPWYAGETGLSSVNGNEIVVAENVWKKVLFSIAYGAADYVWYNLRATGWEENDPEAGFGLMTRDFQPRAGYAAFSSLATLLEGATFERILVSEKTREAYLFRKGDGKFVVGWDSQCFEPVEIPIRADVAQAAAIDLMGNRCPLVAESGTFTWKLGQRPSAVFFPGAKEVEPDRERICAVADPERRIPVRA